MFFQTYQLQQPFIRKAVVALLCQYHMVEQLYPKQFRNIFQPVGYLHIRPAWLQCPGRVVMRDDDPGRSVGLSSLWSSFIRFILLPSIFSIIVKYKKLKGKKYDRLSYFPECSVEGSKKCLKKMKARKSLGYLP